MPSFEGCSKLGRCAKHWAWAARRTAWLDYVNNLAAAVLPRIGLRQRVLVYVSAMVVTAGVHRLYRRRALNARHGGSWLAQRRRIRRRCIGEPTTFDRRLCHRSWSGSRRRGRDRGLDDNWLRALPRDAVAVIDVMATFVQLRPTAAAKMAAGLFRANHLARHRTAGQHRTNHCRKNQTFVSIHGTPPPRHLGYACPAVARHEQLNTGVISVGRSHMSFWRANRPSKERVRMPMRSRCRCMRPTLHTRQQTRKE